MEFKFRKVKNGYAPVQDRNAAYLFPNNWDDYGFKTLFNLIVFDENGNLHDIGNVKIGFFGQESDYTESKIHDEFDTLSDNFFSLGQDADYYKKIVEELSSQQANSLLNGLKDISKNLEIYHKCAGQHVFDTSLLRSVNGHSIEKQFHRIVNGSLDPVRHEFEYEFLQEETNQKIGLEFLVDPSSVLPSNIHVLIGRNGVGKTTILNNMIASINRNNLKIEGVGRFVVGGESQVSTFSQDYFNGVVSISFSAFDRLAVPEVKELMNTKFKFHYVGLKRPSLPITLKSFDELATDFAKCLMICLSVNGKRNRWKNCISTFEYGGHYSDYELLDLEEVFDKDSSDEKTSFVNEAENIFKALSSGHAIVLLSITKLVEVLEENTLVIIDEPESHLHPPLLSSFIGVLSQLLLNRNGVAIIATHSPVVLQEIQRSCVYILDREDNFLAIERPEMETFGENLGLLTREAFNLEVSQSGYHAFLRGLSRNHSTYQEALDAIGEKIGLEGRGILRSIFSNKKDI